MFIGTNRIDFEGRMIDGPAGHHAMEAKVMALLRVLVEHEQKVMSREDLITAVWGVEYGGDERLTRAISLLRKALGDVRGQHTHIQTISKQGYRLIAAVTHDSLTVVPQVIQPALAPEPIAFLENVSKVDPNNAVIIPSATIPSATTAGVTTPVITAPTDIRTVDAPKPKKTLSYWMGVCAATVIAAVIISVGFMALRPSGYISVQAGMEEGLGYVENFTAKDAIEDAQDIFGLILADDPDHAAARAGLALALMREYTHLERDPAILQRAKATAEAALRADEHLALANIAVGWAAEYSGEFERAHSFYDKADILSPENKLTLEGRARNFNKQGMIDETRKILEYAITAYPDYAGFRLLMGEILLGVGDISGAEQAFKKGIKLSKDNPRAYAQLAQALHLQDKTTEAIEAIQDGLQINETALLYNNLGTYLFFQGQYDMAAKAFERTIELKGDSHDYLYWANLADSYRWTAGQKKEANLAYMRALQLLQVELDKYPNNKDLNSRAALYNAKLGDFEAAQAALGNIVVTGELSSTQCYRLAVSYEIITDRPQSLILLGRAIKDGYPLTEIKNDPELSNLRQDPAYHHLLTNSNVQKEGQDL